MAASSAQMNAPPAGSAVRQPRGVVKINGNVVPGWIDFSVTNNTYFEADTFRVTYSATALTRTVAPDALYDATWFSEIATDTFIEILAAARVTNPDKPDPSEMTSLIYGRIDDIEYNPKSRTITLTGRDLTGALIDAKVPRDYTNQTASYIATDLAKQHNLAPVVTATTGKVGTAQPNGDVELIQTEGSDWDLLASLARQAGFICYVQQQSLYFQPESSDPDTYQITWTPPTKDAGYPTASVVDLTFSRSLTIVKGVTVKAMSPGRINKPSVTRYYPTAPKSITPGKATPYGPTTLYTYRLPADMTPNAVEQFALNKYKLITSHAMKLTAKLPADGVLAPRGVIINVSGTGTAYDQTYYPRSVTRTLSVEEGYAMTVEAQNFTPNLASSGRRLAMMSMVTNAMRLQAERAAAHIVVSRIGLVTNYDPTRYMAKVALQPEGSPTGWLPIDSIWVGSGWGLYSPPSINEMVTVVFIDGKLNAGYVQARHYNNQDKPLAVPSGEFWLFHAKGQFVQLTNDGKLTLSDGQGATIALNGDGTMTSAATTWNHTGNINLTGELTATVDIVADGISLLSHVHGGVQGGDSDTGAPV